MFNESRYITIPNDEIPIELMKELPRYSVTLVGLGKESAPAHCGVGTLVRLRENHYILTAAHCARPLAKCSEVGIPVGGRYYIRFPVIPPIYVGQPGSAEWGPDLAFLHVPPIKVGEITAISSSLFYDMDKHAEEMLDGEPEIDKGLWTIVGTPACISDLEDQNNLRFTKMTYSGGVQLPVMKDDFDYIEVRANLGLNTVPPSFKGLSGGGLWQTEVGRKPDGALVLMGKPRLEGCAFYETRPPGEYAYIRCHGRRSIYKHAQASLSSGVR